ncbi:MAG TPA: carboxypeptidase regulatory-like domain-containing protein [Thermoanaerobaculia bacterium]|nr:carboxypeptidase regulatory-like domain-containing protein [Thermoanaerobaculia bacterium]
MRMRLSPILWLVLLLLAGAAFAQQTGSVSGVVRDSEGQPLPGATVTIKGPLLPTGTVEVTRDNGAYDFERLPPGEYQLTAELSGMGTAERAVIVSVGRDTQVNLDLGAAAVSEEITVSAVAPVIDTRSTEVQVNFTQEAIEDLPITRTYKGLFQLAPGVSENNRLAPNAGGARMDNTFLVDGINITNPHYGDILPNITELDIDEVNIKRGGVTAEFGRTGGMVVNAVTKSGTNDLNGRVRLEYQPADFVADSKDKTLQNTVDRENFAGALGGPIVRDRLWYYGSASFPSETTTDRVNNLGPVPDRELKTEEYFLKLTSNPASAHSLFAALRSRDTTTDLANVGASSHPSVATNDSTDYLLGTLGWTWVLTPNSFVEAKYNHNKEENSIDPITDLGYRPTFDPAHPERMGSFTTTADRIVGGAIAAGQTVGGNSLAVNNQDFTRDEVRATFQSLQGWWGADHDLRFGVSYDEDSERLERLANGWGTLTWNPTTKLFTASYVSAQPPHTGRGQSYGVFLQDEVTFGERTTVTAGLLVNKDVYYGEGATSPQSKFKKKILTFDWDQEIQPRLGISFVPDVDKGDKLYAFFGRYNNTENKSLVRAASPTRIFTTRATIDATGKVISDIPAQNTQTKTIDPGLDPQYTDEYLAGYARPLTRTWSAEIFGLYREVGDIMEDVSADGLGNGPFHVAQLPGAYRKYTAATLMLNRLPLDDALMHLTVNASYTWSRLKGNWDIDYAESLFYNSSFLQDGPGVLITDNRDGLLRGDRTHVLKVFATVEPWQHGRIGGYLRYQSGGAWEARGLPDANVSSSSYVRYLEKAGSRRMEDWTNLDLLVSHSFDFGVLGLEVEGRILNVFDEQVATQVDDRLILGRATAPNNPNFGRATEISAPRAYVVSAILNF